MMGVIVVRCQLCEELSFDPRTDTCSECGWEGGCFVCGSPLAAPAEDQFCSSSCRGVALDEEHAELMRDR